MKSRSRNRRSAFSFLELLVTLTIMALVMTALLGVLGQTQFQMATINREMSQRASVQFSLDRLMEDVITGSQDGIDIDIDKYTYGWNDTSQLIIKSKSGENSGRQIEWVGVPREFEGDLVLYRRQKQPGDEEPALYIPQCENLYSFNVDMLDPNGSPAQDIDKSSVIEVQVQIFQSEERDPDYVINVRRTFSLKRF